MKWRGVLELNCQVEAETEQLAQQKLKEVAQSHEWIIWKDE